LECGEAQAIQAFWKSAGYPTIAEGPDLSLGLNQILARLIFGACYGSLFNLALHFDKRFLSEVRLAGCAVSWFPFTQTKWTKSVNSYCKTTKK
jgi:hypothetical protein